MRKILKYIAPFIIPLGGIAVILLAGGTLWLKHFSWKQIATYEEMKYNGDLVMISKGLPLNFSEVYKLIHGQTKEISMVQQAWKALINPQEKYDCKCDDIGYLAWNNDNLKLKLSTTDLLKSRGYWKFGFGLEEFSSPKKCFDFWLHNNIRWEGKYLIDLNDLSRRTIKKNVEDLTIDEIIGLIAWHDILRFGQTSEKDHLKRYEVLKTVYESKKSQ